MYEVQYYDVSYTYIYIYILQSYSLLKLWVFHFYLHAWLASPCATHIDTDPLVRCPIITFRFIRVGLLNFS